jgi:hypothetical protein
MRPIFIGGCERSGTTMLGAMLGGHSQCVCVPESQFIDHQLARADFHPDSVEPRRVLANILSNPRYRLLWHHQLDLATVDVQKIGSTYAQVLCWLVHTYGRKVGKANTPVWIDHTPTNFRRDLMLLRMFPDARFIHLVRDGRGVAASVIPLDWGPNNIVHAAEFWMARCAFGLAAEVELGLERVLRIRYEDVLADPERTLRRVATFAGLEYEPAMIEGVGHQPARYNERQHRLVGHAPDRSRAAGWQRVLSAREVEIFEAEVGDFLMALGYQPQYGIRALPVRRTEVFRMRVRDLAQRARNNLQRQWRARRSME